jgi:hypothetical protein
VQRDRSVPELGFGAGLARLPMRGPALFGRSDISVDRAVPNRENTRQGIVCGPRRRSGQQPQRNVSRCLSSQTDELCSFMPLMVDVLSDFLAELTVQMSLLGE